MGTNIMGTNIDDEWSKFCENENEDIMRISSDVCIKKTPLTTEKKRLMDSKKTSTVIKKKKQIIVADGVDANAVDANEVDANAVDANANEDEIDADANGVDADADEVDADADANGVDADANEVDANGVDANEVDANEVDADEVDADANEVDAVAIRKAFNNNNNKCTDLYISTQTKISYLNMPIILNDVFWQIPIIPYHTPHNGVVKKQMKFNSTLPEEVDDILLKSKEYDFVHQHIISQIIKPDGRIKYKDVRKVSIGLCKKDITSSRCKKKSAFYNCFVVILRLLHNDVYKEINVKVFNTGKLEIPGIQNKEILEKVLHILVEVLTPIVNIVSLEPEFKLRFLEHKSETVLINSNFSCGYYINREKMYELLKYKYKINSAYDPCSYPGIQCEFYYNNKTSELVHQSGMQNSYDKNSIITEYTKVSFMIFRTGSVLIVGKCTESILYKIYEFLCTMLMTERDVVKEPNAICKEEISSKVNKFNKKGRKIVYNTF